MEPMVTARGRSGWLHTLGAAGAILLPLALLFSFFTSQDTGDTAAELIAYADDNPVEVWTLQLIALTAPVLIGAFVASLWTRLRGAHEGHRALVLVGGTLFVAFLSVGLTLWAAPLIASDDLNEAGAEAYLAFDDAGWVLLGLAGISVALLIVGVSLAAIERGWLPKWAGWVSLLLGVASLATIVAVGIFAWALWLLAAGILLLVRGDRFAAAPAGEPPLE